MGSSSRTLRRCSQTFFGQLADEIAGRHAPTAFDRGINRFTLLMIQFIVVMGPLVFLIRRPPELRRFGNRASLHLNNDIEDVLAEGAHELGSPSLRQGFFYNLFDLTS